MEYRVVRPDGSIRQIRDRSFPVKDDTGQVIRMVGIAEDITERKQSEDTIRSLLRISEQLNSSFDVDALLDILVKEAIQLVHAESGLAGIYTSAGMVCQKYFQNGIQIPLKYVWPPMHGLPGWLIVHRVPYLTNDARSDCQIVSELRDRFDVRSALSAPILNGQGDVLGFVEVHNKLGGFTELDREKMLSICHAASTAIENARRYQEAREADQRKDEFLAMLAHELRNPLAPIRSGLDILAMEGSSLETIDVMRQQIQHVVRLVDDLLDVARVRRGRIELRKQFVDLTTLVRRSVESTSEEIEKQQKSISVTLPEHPVWLCADPVRMVQVLENLLTNAIKYTVKGDQIELIVEVEGEHVLITVRDSGIGIEAEFLSKIFEPFMQVSRSLDRSQGGLGVGLTLVQRLVEIHDGTIIAHSDGLEKGSTFVIRLPVAEPEHSEAETPKSFRLPSCRILVVDDNVGAATMLSLLLSKFGSHQVKTAHDGPTALAMIKEMQPNIVLLDIGLPGMDGYEVARSIRRIPELNDVLLVALTGYGQKEDRERSTEAGFDKHLVKPVDALELQQVLTEAKRLKT